MTTTVRIENEAHTSVLKKQLEFREKNIEPLPSIPELVNKAIIAGIKEIKVEQR